MPVRALLVLVLALLAVPARAETPLGQVTPLQFKQISEGEAIYYLAQFPFNEREMLNFTLNVQRADEAPHSFSFDQEFFPDE